MPSLLQRAVLELGINVPVYRADFDERRHVVLLYLYGGQVAEWTPPEFREERATTTNKLVTTNESSVPTVATPEAEPVETLTPSARTDPVTTPPTHDDLTLIPSVGAKTADRLHDAGLHTFLSLTKVDDHVLKDLVGGYTAAKIRDFLYVHSIGETHHDRR
jgi:predicted flap endonuclease-1-like 5' DNA nuclease